MPTTTMVRRNAVVQVAYKLVKNARYTRNIYEEMLMCPDCQSLPQNPVTGSCGHTRCIECIQRNGKCPCGTPEPFELNCNVLVRDIIEHMIHKILRLEAPTSRPTINMVLTEPSGSTNRLRKGIKYPSLIQLKRNLRRIFATPQLRYEFACELISYGRTRDAAAHLAFAASRSWHGAKKSLKLLIEVIISLNPRRIPRSFTCSMYRSIRQQSLTGWINPFAIECPICYNQLHLPITTPCGHMFCRACLQRSMETRKVCPLCSSALDDFTPALAADTEFVCAVLGTVSIPSALDLPTVIPLFTCTVAYPHIACPMMFLNNDLLKAVNSVLDGSRMFGVLASFEDVQNSIYGTMVEIRDCVFLEDGRAILSTVGISRFRVVETGKIDGATHARVEELCDAMPMSQCEVDRLQEIAHRIKRLSQRWLTHIDDNKRTSIENCFGPFPEIRVGESWWHNPNGPQWLWWLIAILPLRTEIQLLMLSTKHLHKRMMAVYRTLDTMVNSKRNPQ